MSSRKELNIRARVVGIDPANYANDSQLEQRVIYNELNQATVAGTLANTTLTSDATNNSDADTITIGPVTYTYKTTLTEVVATNTLTSNNTNVSDGDTVTINNLTYRFKTTIVRPYDVNIGATADLSLTNLVSAITAAGTIGTDYATGTIVNPDVTAAAVSSHATVITAIKPGVFGNKFTMIPTAVTLTATGVNFTSGVDPVANQIKIGASASASLDNTKSAINGTTGAGSTYSTGTIAHPMVTAGAKGATTLVVTAIKAASGFSIASTAAASHLSWTAATIGSNVQAIIANPAYSAAASYGALV